MDYIKKRLKQYAGMLFEDIHIFHEFLKREYHLNLKYWLIVSIIVVAILFVACHPIR